MSDPQGLNLQLPNGKPVQLKIMGEDDDWLDLTMNPEAGVFGFENEDTAVTVFLEDRE